MIIGRYTKQPAEVLDYTADLTEWLAPGDYAVSATATVDAGVTLDATLITDGGKGIRVWVSGGTSGQKSKVQVVFVTDQARTKEYEFVVTVKEY